MVLVVGGCGYKNPAGQMPPTPVTVERLQALPGTDSSGYSGSVNAYQSVDAAFKVGGYLTSILQVRGADGRMRSVQGGDGVAAGQILAIVDERPFRQKVQEARAALAAATAEYRKADRDLQRYSELFRHNIVPQAQLDNIQRQSDDGKAAVRASEAELRNAELSLSYCKLASPLSGTVLRRKVEVGTLVDANSVGFQIGNLDSMKVDFGVPDLSVSRLLLGNPQAITVAAVPGVHFAGTVTRIAPVADPDNRLFEVEVTVPNTDHRLRVGMIAHLELHDEGTGVAAALVVPLGAVVRPPTSRDGFAVYTIHQDGARTIAHLQPIVPGRLLGSGVAVKQGLSAGDRIIVNGADMVSDGQPVSVIP